VPGLERNDKRCKKKELEKMVKNLQAQLKSA
jgi:hypothetical protein